MNNTDITFFIDYPPTGNYIVPFRQSNTNLLNNHLELRFPKQEQIIQKQQIKQNVVKPIKDKNIP